MTTRIVLVVVLTGAVLFWSTPDASAQVRVFGSEHAALGGASLGSSPTGGLIVSNIGSSGQDGVSVDLGESEGAAIEISEDTIGVGRLATETVKLIGSVGGNPGVDLGGIQFNTIGNTVELIGIVPQVSGSYEFELTVVDDAGLSNFPRVLNGGPLGTLEFSPDGVPLRAALSIQEMPKDQGSSSDPQTIEICVGYSEDFLNAAIPGGGGGKFAVVRITPASGTTLDIDSISSLEFTGAVANPIDTALPEIDDEVLVMFDHGVGARGNVAFDALGGKLTVSNIGSSGQDGVRVHLDDAPDFRDTDSDDDSLLEQILAANLFARDAASGLPTGKRQHKPIQITKQVDKSSPLIMSALVNNEESTGAGPTGTLYSSSVDNTGSGQVVLSTDFSPLGTTQYEIEVSQNGVPLATVTGDETSLISLDGLPSGEPVVRYTTQYDETDWDFVTRATSVLLPGASSPTLLDGASPVLISMRALVVTNVPLGKSSIDFRYTGAGDVVIADIQSVPEPATLVLGLAMAAGLALRRWR